MKNSNKVLKHPIFIQFLQDIKAIEADRIYCHHELEHAMDVARLAWIYYLEGMAATTVSSGDKKCCLNEESSLAELKDFIYTASLLHDIGRVAQYQTGVHHSISGLEPAKRIMEEIEIPSEWVPQILDIIAEHGNDPDQSEKNVGYYIAKADHDCRLCFSCSAYDSCKWTEDEKNNSIVS